MANMLSREFRQSIATSSEFPGQDVVMWRKIFIGHLLLALVMLPVAQAVDPVVAPADSDRPGHALMVMDCGQLDPKHCIDFETCFAGSHASCDAKFESTQLLPQSMDQPRDQAFTSHPPDRYLSYLAELLLRPPRNA